MWGCLERLVADLFRLQIYLSITPDYISVYLSACLVIFPLHISMSLSPREDCLKFHLLVVRAQAQWPTCEPTEEKQQSALS